MTDHPNLAPIPDLADIPMKPTVDPASVDAPGEIAGDDPADPPVEDLTLPTE